MTESLRWAEVESVTYGGQQVPKRRTGVRKIQGNRDKGFDQIDPLLCSESSRIETLLY